MGVWLRGYDTACDVQISYHSAWVLVLESVLWLSVNTYSGRQQIMVEALGFLVSG